MTSYTSPVFVTISTWLPFFAQSCAQVALMFGVASATAYAMPRNVALLIIAVLAGAIMCAGMAFATSAFTKSAEAAQVTTMPFIIAALGGALLVTLQTTQFAWAGRLLPGGAIVELIVGAWKGTAWVNAWPALLALAAWTFIAVTAAARFFKWEPRS